MKQIQRTWLLLLVVWCSGLTATAQTPTTNYAAVVVQYESGDVDTRCVAFAEESLTGYELLERAGFMIQAQGNPSMGALVCSINQVGCDYPNEACACRCQGGECTYWAYSQLMDTEWKHSPIGASSRTIRNGDVDGWSWGSGDTETGATPPTVSVAEACEAQQNPPSVPVTATELEPLPNKVEATVTPLANRPSSAKQATPWINYAIFGLIMLGLIAATIMQRKRTA